MSQLTVKPFLRTILYEKNSNYVIFLRQLIYFIKLHEFTVVRINMFFSVMITSQCILIFFQNHYMTFWVEKILAWWRLWKRCQRIIFRGMVLMWQLQQHRCSAPYKNIFNVVKSDTCFTNVSYFPCMTFFSGL